MRFAISRACYSKPLEIHDVALRTPTKLGARYLHLEYYTLYWLSVCYLTWRRKRPLRTANTLQIKRALANNRFQDSTKVYQKHRGTLDWFIIRCYSLINVSDSYDLFISLSILFLIQMLFLKIDSFTVIDFILVNVTFTVRPDFDVDFFTQVTISSLNALDI